MSDIEERYAASDQNAAKAQGVVHHPLIALVFKTAVAAGFAYAAGNGLPGSLDDYAYYAPLGAVTVMYPAVADSVLQGVKATAAILIGVGLAVATMFLTWPNAVSVGVVIGLGTALAALGWFGEQRSWLPLAALFVLTASEPHTEVYVLGYVTQLPLGAAIGIIANIVLFPQMSLHDLHNAVRSVRVLLVDQLNRMARVLRDDADIDQSRWLQSLEDLDDPRREMRALWSLAQRSQKGNIRSKRWSGVQRDLLQLAGALDRCSFLVEDISVILTEFEGGERPLLGQGLRSHTADTLEALAEVLSHPQETSPDSPRTRRAQEMVDRLVEAINDGEFSDARSRFLAGAVAVSVGRALLTFARRHGAEELEELGDGD